MKSTGQNQSVNGFRQKKTYKKRIDWLPVNNKSKILQIYNKGLEYSLVSNDFKQCHPFILCKDFLQDVVHASVNKKSFEIYKFQYNFSTQPNSCINETRIIVSNSKDKKLSKKIKSCLDFINQIELKLKMPYSKVNECIDPPENYADAGVYLFRGHRRWIQSPPMLSLYTLLIRIGFSHTIGNESSKTIKAIKEGEIKPYQPRDAWFITEVEPALHKIIRIGDRKIFFKDIRLNYPKSMNIDLIHNKLGIVAFASDLIAKACGQSVPIPYWHMFK